MAPKGDRMWLLIYYNCLWPGLEATYQQGKFHFQSTPLNIYLCFDIMLRIVHCPR